MAERGHDDEDDAADDDDAEARQVDQRLQVAAAVATLNQGQNRMEGSRKIGESARGRVLYL